MLSGDIDFIFDNMSYPSLCIFNWIALYFNILLLTGGPLVLVLGRISRPGIDYLPQGALVLISGTGTTPAVTQFIAMDVGTGCSAHSCGVCKPYFKSLHINHQKGHLQ